jgi:demethylmenaquinone methyltransferase / 2-methoxy-6-polyprenyl-1,4-benzoquinol methylase
MSFKLPTREEKAAYVHEQFERIASGYDFSNDVISMGMHRAWKLRAVQELVESNPNGKFLDVCCGTGDLSLLIARLAGADSTVTGLDFSQNMLDTAELRRKKRINRLLKRKKDAGTLAKHIDWVRGDAENLPFASETFDGAIISFGLRNLTDLQKGLNEMARVVKPGGRVINLDLGHSTVPIFAPVFSAYFSHVVPIVGGIIQNDRKAYTYLPQSLSTYPHPEEITAMFEKAGLVKVQHIPLALGSVALHIGTRGR